MDALVDPAGAAVLPARTAIALQVPAGAHLDIVTPTGSQVVDTWALALPDLQVVLSMSHTRTVLMRLVPRAGDILYGSDRRPMLTLLEDTSPGVHDTLIASCDAERYRMLGYDGLHANCHDNFASALRQAGFAAPRVPQPLNLFQNSPWAADGSLRLADPVAAPGDGVRLRAEIDVVVVLSACPQDMAPTNGVGREPTDVLYRLVPAT